MNVDGTLGHAALLPMDVDTRGLKRYSSRTRMAALMYEIDRDGAL